jgi:hypothetical protein
VTPETQAGQKQIEDGPTFVDGYDWSLDNKEHLRVVLAIEAEAKALGAVAERERLRASIEGLERWDAVEAAEALHGRELGCTLLCSQANDPSLSEPFRADSLRIAALQHGIDAAALLAALDVEAGKDARAENV